jgi:hypothetical protein
MFWCPANEGSSSFPTYGIWVTFEPLPDITDGFEFPMKELLEFFSAF